MKKKSLKFVHWTESSHSFAKWLSSDKAPVISPHNNLHLDMLTLCSPLYISVTLFNPSGFWRN